MAETVNAYDRLANLEAMFRHVTAAHAEMKKLKGVIDAAFLEARDANDKFMLAFVSSAMDEVASAIEDLERMGTQY